MPELGTKVFGARNLDDPTAFSEMRQAIILGQFTPFLGAGASSLRPYRPDLAEYPWSEIWKVILAVRDGLEKPSQILYLQSFAVQRLRLDENRRQELDPNPERMLRKDNAKAGNPRDWPQEALIDFQTALVRFATEIGQVFGEAFAKSYAAVGRVSDLEVAIDPEAKNLADLIVELLHLVDLAKELPDTAFPPKALVRGRRKPPSFKKQEVYSKLVMLTFRLVNDGLWQSELMKGWRDRHVSIIKSFPSETSRPRKGDVAIGIEILEWLPELLWYSLRYWTPCLPTTAEMAFDLALGAYLAPPVKVDLAQAAEALRLPQSKLAEDIRDWFEYCHEQQPRLTRFHVAIAAVLQHMHDMYKRREEEKARKSASQLPAAESSAPVYLPVAFTTNFDRLLEQVFEELQITYHIVFPVRRRRSTQSGDNPSIKWKFQTRYSRSATEKPFKEDMWCDEVLSDEGKRDVLSGPVIVKLHGSPLDGGDNEHWLVLSELGYLEALDQKQCKLPTWLERQLAGESELGDQEDGRSLWFLGYSITDWNVRLRLYEHLRYGPQARGASSRRAVDRRVDSVRMAILGSLSVEVYVGDLNVLPRMILSALGENPASQRSRELERLVARLEEEAQ